MKQTIKKIISFFLAITILGTVPTAFGKTTSATWEDEISAKISFLKKLEIIEDIDYSKNLTRYDAIKYIVKLNKFTLAEPKGIMSDVSKDNEYAPYVETAFENGLILGDGNNNFMGNDDIKYVDFIKILLKVCGYDKYINYIGSYPYGYIKQAKISGLSKNVDFGGADDSVSLQNGVILLYNALEIDMMEQKGFSDEDIVFNVIENKNLLNSVYKLKKVKDILNATELTGIYSKDGVSGAKIGNSVYSCNKEYQRYLGYEVLSYIDENKNVFFMTPTSKNRITKVKSSDIIIGATTKTNIIYRDKDDRQYNLKIKYNGNYMVNDVYFANIDSNLITDDTFKNQDKVYTFLDNNNDGIYELIFEENYEYFFIGQKDDEERIIVDKLKNQSLKLLTTDIISYEDGTVIPFENLKYNDVLGFKPRNGITLDNRSEPIEFTVFQNVVGGIYSHATDDEIYVENKKYRVNKKYLSNAKELPNINGSFYLDGNNNVLAFESDDNNSSAIYAYFADVKQNGLSNPIAKVLLQTGELTTKNISEKVSIYRGASKIGSTVDTLIKIKNQVCGKIVKINFTNDEIKRIELPSPLTYGQNGGKSSFNCVAENKYRPRGEGILNDIYRLPKTSIAFIVPENGVDDKIFSVKKISQVVVYEDISLELYNVNDEFTAGMTIIKEKEATQGPVSAEDHIFVVEKLTQAVTEDNEPTFGIIGMLNGEKKSYRFYKEDMKAKTFDVTTDVKDPVINHKKVCDLKFGDILSINETNGIINSFRMVLDTDEKLDFARQGSNDWDGLANWPLPYVFVNKAMLLTYGTILEKQNDIITYELNIQKKQGDGYVYENYIKNAFTSQIANVYLVDSESSKVTKTKVIDSNIKAGERVFLTMLWGRERDLVVYIN